MNFAWRHISTLLQLESNQIFLSKYRSHDLISANIDLEWLDLKIHRVEIWELVADFTSEIFALKSIIIGGVRCTLILEFIWNRGVGGGGGGSFVV